MMIETQNPGGRSIVRADRATFPNDFGYRRMTDGQPSLQCRIEGMDGKQYTILITDADLDALNIARVTYTEAFRR